MPCLCLVIEPTLLGEREHPRWLGNSLSYGGWLGWVVVVGVCVFPQAGGAGRCLLLYCERNLIVCVIGVGPGAQRYVFGCALCLLPLIN